MLQATIALDTDTSDETITRLIEELIPELLSVPEALNMAVTVVAIERVEVEIQPTFHPAYVHHA